jgi:hypothetical protein
MDPDYDGTVSQDELDAYMNAKFKKAMSTTMARWTQKNWHDFART